MSLTSVNLPGNGPMEMEESSSRPSWHDKILGLLIAILCFEMGIFLIAFPWSGYWSQNFFSWLTPEWRELWMNSFFRGAVSGFGLLNLYLALSEVFRLQGLREKERGND